MSDSPKRPPGRPRSEASRAALLDAAYWRAMELGYAALTVDAIAKAAGAGKQTIYRWWPSKAAFVIAALAAKAAERIDRPREAAVRDGDLVAFLKAEFAALRPFGPSLRALFAEAQGEPADLAAFRAALIEPRMAALTAILGRRLGEADAAVTLAEAIDGAVWRALALGAPLDDALARRLAALAPARS